MFFKVENCNYQKQHFIDETTFYQTKQHNLFFAFKNMEYISENIENCNYRVDAFTIHPLL